MSNNQNLPPNDNFIIKQINMIKELYEGEKFLNNKISNKNSFANVSVVLFDKEWLENWKRIVCYEILKEKCIKCNDDKQINNIIGEVRDLFIKYNTEQNFNALDKMKTSKLKKPAKKKNIVKIDEKSKFIPILSSYCSYFMSYMESPITIKSKISNGIIYIHDPIPAKNEEKKLILLYIH